MSYAYKKREYAKREDAVNAYTSTFRVPLSAHGVMYERELDNIVQLATQAYFDYLKHSPNRHQAAWISGIRRGHLRMSEIADALTSPTKPVPYTVEDFSLPNH